MNKLVVKDKSELYNAISNAIQKYGDNVDLNFIDTSQITDMSCIFSYSTFNGDISRWDVSRVTNMSCMFMRSLFNGNIENWDTRNVRSMKAMFKLSKFKGNLQNWDIRKVTDLDQIFGENKYYGWNTKETPDLGLDFSVVIDPDILDKWIEY